MQRLLTLLLICSTAFAQVSPSRYGSQQPEQAGFVVRINVKLVQVDAVVTDAKGSPVPGLDAKDFEVYQDGLRQPITTFSYVANGVNAGSRQRSSSRTKNDFSIPAPPVPLTREHLRRTVVLMVDDMALSPTGVAFVRVALKKFVDHDMQPGDLVAIVRTAGGLGSLQQLTTDKQLLHAAIDQVKVDFMARAASFALPKFARSLEGPSVGPGGTSAPTEYATMYEAIDEAEKCELEANSTFGSLAAIRYAVDGLRDLPGRKTLVLLSERLQISQRPDLANASLDSDKSCDRHQAVQELMRRVTDAAERSAVVIYTIDPHGFDPLVPDASSNPFAQGPVKSGTAPGILISAERDMRLEDFYSKGGLQKLADETGGTFSSDNDTGSAIRQAVNDSSNYYLLGYRPPASTFEGKDRSRTFHRVTVKLKRAGLKVRSREGFYGFPGPEKETPTNLSKDEQFGRALTSPFAQNDIHLRMTTLFSQLEAPVLTTFVSIDTKDLTFARDADDKRKATLDAIAITYDKNGMLVDNTQRNYILTTKDDSPSLSGAGAILTLQQKAKKPGPYLVRVGIQDARSGKIGSANQFIAVPDLSRRRLTLSGILLRELDPATGRVDLSKQAANSRSSDPMANEAIRIFKTGETVGWYYQIFNAKTGGDQTANLKVQVRIFRDGAPLMQSAAVSVRFRQNPSTKYVATSGHMVLGPNFAPGDYILQLIVQDDLAKRKYSTASQWIDFSVENP